MSIQQLSFQAQLAQAAYATLSNGMSTQEILDAVQAQSGGFTDTQAQQFAANEEGNGVRSCLLPPRHRRTQTPLASYLSAAPRVQGSVQPLRSSG